MAGPDEGEGTGDTLEEAAEAAWEDAKEKPGNDPGWYEVKKIDVKGQNPITEYRVKIKKI